MAMSVRASHSPFISVPFYFRVKFNCSGSVNVVAEAKCHSSVLKFLSVLSLSRFETLTSSLQGEGGRHFCMQNWTEEEKILSQMRTWSQALRALSFGEIFIGGTHEGSKKSTKKHHQQQRKHGC